MGDDGQIGHIEAKQPALFASALALEIAGTPVLAEWTVASDARAEWQAAGEHFFASLVCAAP